MPYVSKNNNLGFEIDNSVTFLIIRYEFHIITLWYMELFFPISCHHFTFSWKIKFPLIGVVLYKCGKDKEDGILNPPASTPLSPMLSLPLWHLCYGVWVTVERCWSRVVIKSRSAAVKHGASRVDNAYWQKSAQMSTAPFHPNFM